jgi:hypothetical protein
MWWKHHNNAALQYAASETTDAAVVRACTANANDNIGFTSLGAIMNIDD